MELTNKAKVPITLGAGLVFCVFSCSKNNTDIDRTGPVAQYLNLPVNPFNYTNPPLPAYLLAPPVQGQINTPADNPVSDWGATLGRVLFYDKTLSKNRTISCASCYKQENAFSDFEKFSRGFESGLTGRNSMALINARYFPNGRFFWDQRAATPEQQVLTPVQDPVEIGIPLDTLVKRVKEQPYYPALFASAFGTDLINSDRILKSIVAVRSFHGFLPVKI